MSDIIEANSNYNDEGYYTSINTTLGRINVGQIVNNWTNPTLSGESPIKPITPTVINLQNIINQLSAVSVEDRTASYNALNSIINNHTWNAEEYMNYDIQQVNDVFEKGVFWLTRGGTLQDGGTFIGMNGEGTAYLGMLYGKVQTTYTEEDPDTGSITTHTRFNYYGSIYSFNVGTEYLYFTQEWDRNVTGSGSDDWELIPPSETWNAKRAILHTGNYPIDFIYNDIEEHESSSLGTTYGLSDTIHVVGGAGDAGQFASRYNTNYTEFMGVSNPLLRNTWVRGPQYRANDYRFNLSNFFNRPDLDDNQRWVSGNDIWNPNPDNPGSGSGAGGAPGSASGGGYNPDALDTDNVAIPTIPTTDVARAGLCGVYNISESSLRALTNWLWSSNFFDSIIKNFNSPMENIIMLGVVPFNQFQGTSSYVSVGNCTSEISATKLSKTMYEVDCGTIDVSMPYNSFGSFEPYSKYQLYLPYIGVVDIPSDDVALRVVGGAVEYGKIHVVYHFDVFTGACMAYIQTCTNRHWNVTAQYTGNLLTTFPISQTNFLQVYQTLISARASIAQAGLNTVASVLNPTASVGSIAGSAGGVASSMGDTINNLIGIRPTYGRCGQASSAHGMLGVRKPYLIKTLGRVFESDLQRDNKGYVSKLGVTIGNQTGYVKARMDANKVYYIDGATEGELAEIKQLLTSGIYI